MTSAGRLYAVLTAIVVFFLSWATVAAHPWQKTGPDPRLVALAQRRSELHRESLRVRRVLNRRWAVYRVALGRRQRLNARLAAQARAAQQVITVSRPTQFVAGPATSGTQQLASVSSAAPAPVSAPPPVVAVAPATATHTS